MAETTNSIPVIFLITDGAVEDERDICNFVKGYLTSGGSISLRISTFGIGEIFGVSAFSLSIRNLLSWSLCSVIWGVACTHTHFMSELMTELTFAHRKCVLKVTIQLTILFNLSCYQTEYSIFQHIMSLMDLNHTWRSSLPALCWTSLNELLYQLLELGNSPRRENWSASLIISL